MSHTDPFLGLTEEQIVHTFSSVGQVLSFRLVYDQDTGRPKGFGFAEFADTDSAASAVRNLNGYEIMGRELRVDFSHVGGKDESQGNAMSQPQQGPPNGFQPQPSGSTLPPLPPGVELAPNLSCPDAISKTLSTLTAPQLLDILSQMKGLVMGDPARATELLTKAPQLSYAIFQALLLMGLVDTTVLATVVEGSGPPVQAPPPQPMPPQTNPSYQQYPPPQQHPQYTGMPTPMHAPTPPVHNQYQPPPMQQPPPQPQPQAPSQEDLIKTVMAMTQQQIDSLPPNERQQIIALRQSLGVRY